MRLRRAGLHPLPGPLDVVQLRLNLRDALELDLQFARVPFFAARQRLERRAQLVVLLSPDVHACARQPSNDLLEPIESACKRGLRPCAFSWHFVVYVIWEPETPRHPSRKSSAIRSGTSRSGNPLSRNRTDRSRIGLGPLTNACDLFVASTVVRLRGSV